MRIFFFFRADLRGSSIVLARELHRNNSMDTLCVWLLGWMWRTSWNEKINFVSKWRKVLLLQDTPDCDFFVWQGDGSPGKDCHMLKSSTAPVPSPYSYVQEDSCGCFEVNTYYWGTDVGYAPHVASPAECQTLCQETDSCFFWNYATDSSWAPKACFLKGFVESKSRIKKLFSGPKFCS